jgi:hypothetical protein
MVINIKFFYWIWFLANTALLIFSGYLGRVSSAFLKMDWINMMKISDKFYPFDNAVIADYDITEYLVYIITPVILLKIIKAIFGR